MTAFAGILYVDREQAWLVSRKGKKFRQFDPLLKQVLRCLKGQRAIFHGEIVVLNEKGRSNFRDLMARRGDFVPPNDPHLLYVEHLEESDGARFIELVCEQDLEGIICKPKARPYPFTWIKVKNPNYSQAAGHREWFDRLLSAR